jgi:hypothetical protein
MAKKRKTRYASVLAHEDFFWKAGADNRLRWVGQARKRPAEWRFALMFKRNHKPESWNVGPNGFGRDVQFRVSTERNAAGYFVGWRSADEKDGTRAVYDYVADKVRAACRAKTLTRAHRYEMKRGNEMMATELRALINAEGVR